MICSEQDMRKLYKGIDVEVDDWQVLSLKDAFKMAWTIASPRPLFYILSTLIRELFLKKEGGG